MLFLLFFVTPAESPFKRGDRRRLYRPVYVPSHDLRRSYRNCTLLIFFLSFALLSFLFRLVPVFLVVEAGQEDREKVTGRPGIGA